MPFKAVIPVLLAHLVLTSAMPNPNLGSTGFSVGLIKRLIPDLEKRAGGNTASVGVVSTTSQQDKWTIDLVVGDQTLPTVIDTGSSGFWYESVLQQSDMKGSGHPIYTPSATVKSVTGATWAAVYTGNNLMAAGVAYYDKVQIGAATLTSQAVGAVTSLADKNFSRKSGIIGLGPGLYQGMFDSSNPKVNTTIANLKGQLDISQFALDLRYEGNSRLDFGFIDSSRYTGPITYINRNFSFAAWNIRLDNAYYINGNRLSGNISDTNLTLVDSGAPTMTFPPKIVQEYYKTVTEALQDKDGLWRFPCVDKNKQLPSFGVSINNGVTFTVPGTWMWAFQSNKTHCQGSLQTSKGGNSVLGDTFLRTVYAVFDTQFPQGPGKIGFAAKPMPTRAPPA